MERGRNHPHVSSSRAESGLQQAYSLVDLQGVLVMGRKRVSNPRISFSISVDSHLLNKLNMRMGYNQSRSKWIADAIRMKLESSDEGKAALDAATLEEVLAELEYRATHPAFREYFSKSFRAKVGELRQTFRNLPESGE